VHGGGPQADALACKIGHTPVKVGGRRVTREQDLEIAKMLYGGSLNLEILSIMKKLRTNGIRVSGLDGNLLEVKIRSKKKFDYGFVGDIQKVHPQVLLDVLEKGYIAVVSPLACTNKGEILNINADTVASKVASSLSVEKLIFFTDRDGVLNGKEVINVLTTAEAKKHIKEGIIRDGMAVKIENCLEAVSHGVKRVHIINGLSPHSLLIEVLTKKGIGTMVLEEDQKDIYLKE
jgi:acetylglutamate kinase